jgi:hypothetical protein
MALGTYSDLQASIANWLRRADLTAVIPDFITLAEAQINRRLRVRRMVAHAALTIDAEFVAVPADFAGAKTIEVATAPVRDLQYVTTEQMAQRQTRTNAGCPPSCYTVVGGQFRFYPATFPYSASLTYWQRVPSLSDLAPSNWLLETSPDAYLYGALLQSAPYLRADPRIDTWSGLYLAALSDLTDADKIEDSGAALTPIPSTVV